MAKTSFKKKENVEEVEAEASEETQVAKAAPAEVVPHGRKTIAHESKGLSGDFTDKDLRIPYLTMVGKSSELADEFGGGHYVFDKELELSDGKEPINVTFIKADLTYVQDLDFESDETAEEFGSLQEAFDAGFTDNYDDRDDGKYVCPKLQTVVLIEVAEEHASYEFEDKHFALAAYTMQKSAYTNGGKNLVNACLRGHLKEAIYHGPWKLSSWLKKTSFSYYVPKLKRDGLHTKEFIEFLENEVCF